MRSLFFTSALCAVSLASAQSGSIDLTYGSPVSVLGDSTRFNSNVEALIVEPDQKILAAGSFTEYNGDTHNRILRLLPDGTADVNSFVATTGFNGTVYCLARQPDGKILAGGEYTTYNSQPRNRLVRLNANGTLDNSFQIGTGFNSTVASIVVQPDGAILVAGLFSTFNGTSAAGLVRLQTNGTIDPSFSTGAGFNNLVGALALDENGDKIYCGGTFTSFNGASANRIVRLLTDGSADATFTTGTAFNDRVYKMVVNTDGTIAVGGLFTTYNGTASGRVIRLTSSGAIDASFAVAGFDGAVDDVVQDGQGRLLVGGNFTQYGVVARKNLARLLPTGELDPTFYIGTGADNYVYPIALQADGRVVCGGEFLIFNDTRRNGILRLDPDGGLDGTFNVSVSFDDLVYEVTAASQGGVLYGGNFERYDGIERRYFLKLDDSGRLDTSFHSGADGTVRCIVEDTAANKWYIGGYFDEYDNQDRSKFARLNADGTLDATFNIGGGFNADVRSILVQPDGYVLVGGDFTSYDGLPALHLVRLDPYGSIDPGFQVPGAGFTGSVLSMVLQPNGKIVCAGGFQFLDGDNVQYIARLNADGSVDGTFNSGTGFSAGVQRLVRQPDGKLLAAGSFFYYNGSPAYRIIRLNANGTVDPSFDFGTGFSDGVNDIALQEDGKVIAVGLFTSYDGQSRARITRINANGSIDNTFDIGSGFDWIPYATDLQPDGKVVVGGAFSSYDGLLTASHVRLNNDVSTNTTAHSGGITAPVAYPNPTTGAFSIENGPEEVGSVELYSPAGQRIPVPVARTSSRNSFDLGHLPDGAYLLRWVGRHGSSASPIVIKH